MSAVLRLKRKACAEPVEGLVVALKKSKCDETSDTDRNEVLFKFAATLKSETESVKDHIQAVLSKDRSSKYSKWRDPKAIALSQRNVHDICEKLKKEYKAANEKKKLDLLNNRRLIFSETVPIEEDEIDSSSLNTEVRKLFQLYDIIEENEETKKQTEETESIISCNGEPLIREKKGDYVFDVYIADVQIDDSFVENTVSVRPCTITDDDIYSGDSDDPGECYEDEDDSNEENNWRNEYPEDEDTNSDKESDIDESADDFDPFYCGGRGFMENLTIDEDQSYEDGFDRSRILQELKDDDDYSENSE